MSSNRFCPYKIQKSCRKKCTVHYGGGWIGVCKSADPLWFIDLLTKSAAKILPASEIRAKTLLLPAKSKIRAQKMAESAIRWNYRIRESVKISLWIRNPGKNILKIRRSVHLFTPPCYECRFEFVTGYGMPGNDWRIPRIYSWFSHDVTKIQTKKLSLLLSFYFHVILEHLKTN